MRLLLLVTALALPAAPLAAQGRGPPPVTRDQAMRLPPDELARRVLGQYGQQVTSVTRPNFGPDSDMRMVGALQDLTFATAPRPAEMAGLCVADRIDISFEHDGANEAATAVRPRQIRAERVYKVIGEITQRVTIEETRQAEERRRCAQAGSVIDANYSDRGRAHFFHFSGSDTPFTALLVLQRAIGEARAGRYRDIRCAGDAAQCVSQLGALDLATLSSVSIGPAGTGGGRDLRRVSGSFLIQGNSVYRHYRDVEIEVELGTVGGQLDAILRLGRTGIGNTDVHH